MKVKIIIKESELRGYLQRQDDLSCRYNFPEEFEVEGELVMEEKLINCILPCTDCTENNAYNIHKEKPQKIEELKIEMKESAFIFLGKAIASIQNKLNEIIRFINKT